MLERPRALPASAHIAVLAASGPSDRSRIESAAQAIESRGHRVTIASNVGERYRTYLAGSDERRAAELNLFFNSADYDAFFFARGGYGAMRILDRLDYRAFAANPRPLVGFSDVTAIHQALAVRAGVGSFHGPMLNLDFHEGLSPQHERWFWSILAGEAPLIYPLENEQILVDGEAEGVLFGGCLALTVALIGTPYDYWVDGGIWFWEDVDEPVYRIDRMLTHLRLSGRIQRVRGVIVGALKECGSKPELMELLQDFFAPLGVPVVHDLPFGHQGNNLMMPVGAKVRLSTSSGSLTIPEPAVSRPTMRA